MPRSCQVAGRRGGGAGSTGRVTCRNMKTRRPALLVLVLAVVTLSGIAVAGGDPTAPVFWTEVQRGSRALPTSGCGATGEGADLSYITSMHAVVRCSDRSAFTAGWMQAYFCDPGVGAWAKAATYNDFQLSTSTGTLPDGGVLPAVGPELIVTYPFGRFLYAVDGGACAGSNWDGGVVVVLGRAQR